MTSTEFNVGMSSERNSSRVLKPPGGGHTDLFGSSEVKVNSPRPKYDQQNSSNLNFCMNTVDPNVLVEQVKQAETKKTETKPAEPEPAAANKTNGNSVADQAAPQNRGGGRVPPGLFIVYFLLFNIYNI